MYKNIILFVVCVTETLFLVLRERYCVCLEVRMYVCMYVSK
jgi:hypothetical protein